MVKLFSWNERDNPDLSPAQVRSDARKVARRFRGSSIGGGQEFGDRSDHRAARSAFGRRWSAIFGHTSTPTFFNRIWWSWQDGRWAKTHSGIAGITPHRGYTKSKFRHRTRRSLAPLWFYGTHCISKPSASDQRRTLHAEHIEKMRTDIADQREADGLDIFVVGDFNVKHPPNLHPDQVVLHSHWLDHIIYIPGPSGNHVQLRNRITMAGHLYTDHAPIGVNLTLTARTAR